MEQMIKEKRKIRRDIETIISHFKKYNEKCLYLPQKVGYN